MSLRFAARSASTSCLSRLKAKEGAMLIYRCPTTAKIVHSGIEASELELRRLSALKLSLWCPYCQCGHTILGKDAQVSASDMRSVA
jgi:hypothetical protein